VRRKLNGAKELKLISSYMVIATLNISN
jgi:hypothetical protein